MAETRESELWKVSPYNFSDSVRAGMSLPEKVTICDLTLREGRQFEGVALRREEVMLVAHKLAEAGIGMVQVHHDEPEEMREIKEAGLGFTIEALVHPTAALDLEECKREIDLCLEYGADHISPVYAFSDYTFCLYESMAGRKISREQALKDACSAVRFGKGRGAHMACLIMDFTRLDLERLKQIVRELVGAGADIITLDDICAPAIPAVFAHHVREVKRVIPETPIEVHTHDDFGLATAALLASMEAGAEILQAGVNGMGERAGITDTAELACILEILYGIETGIKLEKLCELSRLVADITKVPVPPNLPVVGDRAFSHSSEVHYVLPEEDLWSFNAWQPEAVGNKRRVLWSNYSGPFAVKRKAKELGVVIPEDRVGAVLKKIREEIKIRKRAVSDEEFLGIVKQVG